MKEVRDKSNGEIYKKLIQKVKDVSDVINYKDLNIKYFNSFCPIKKPSQGKESILVRNKLEIELVKLMLYPPLFSKIEIITITDFKIEDKITKQKFLAKIELIWIIDLNEKIVSEKVKILSKREVSEDVFNNTKQKIEIQVCKAIKNNLGNLYYIIEKGDETNSLFARLKHSFLGGIIGGAGAGVLGTIGKGVGIAGLPVVSVGAAVAAGIGVLIGFFKD